MKILLISWIALLFGSAAIAQDMDANTYLNVQELQGVLFDEMEDDVRLGMFVEGGGVRVGEGGIIWVFDGQGWRPINLRKPDGPSPRPTYFQGPGNSGGSPQKMMENQDDAGLSMQPDQTWYYPGYGTPIWNPCHPNSPSAPWVYCANPYWGNGRMVNIYNPRPMPGPFYGNGWGN